MRNDSDSPHTNCLRGLFFQQKVDYFSILPASMKIYYSKYVVDLFHEKRFYYC